MNKTNAIFAKSRHAGKDPVVVEVTHGKGITEATAGGGGGGAFMEEPKDIIKDHGRDGD